MSPAEAKQMTNLLRDAVVAYFAALDEWNGPNGGRGDQEGRLNRAEATLRDLVGVKRFDGTYR